MHSTCKLNTLGVYNWAWVVTSLTLAPIKSFCIGLDLTSEATSSTSSNLGIISGDKLTPLEFAMTP
jgi:hypothetical protein